MNYFSRNNKLSNKKTKYIVIALVIALNINIPVSFAQTVGMGFYKPMNDDEKIAMFLEKTNKKETIKSSIITIDVVKDERIRDITAYNAGDIWQCAGDPCISANGENICNALELGYKRCAANFVPFGTVLEIEGFGQCIVTDRMNSRYPDRVDIAMKYEEKQRALEFGYKRLNVKIIEKVEIETEETIQNA